MTGKPNVQERPKDKKVPLRIRSASRHALARNCVILDLNRRPTQDELNDIYSVVGGWLSASEMKRHGGISDDEALIELIEAPAKPADHLEGTKVADETK